MAPSYSFKKHPDVQAANQLVTELNALGIHFVTGGDTETLATALPPEELLASLAAQPEARLRLAIIPLLLSHPHFASAVPKVVSQLNEPARITLKLFYTAAMLLQQLYAGRLRDLLGQQELLPDLFSKELGLLAKGSPQAHLKCLAERHRSLTGLAANWLGTYTHAAERFLTRLEREAVWQN